MSGAQGGNLCPTALGSSAPGPPGYDRYGQFDSRASLVRGLEHHSPSKTYSRLSERDSRPPISSESANTDRVVPSPRNRETYLQGLGDTRSRHVCNSVELPPSSVQVSNSGANSPSGGCSVSRLAGEVNVHVSPILSAQQSHSEAPVHPDGRGNSHSPLVAESVVVSTPTLSLCGTPSSLSLPSTSSVPAGSEVCLGQKSYHLHAWMLSCDTIKQQVFQTRSLGLQQLLEGPQPIACTTIGGFARWAAGQGFDPLDPTAAQIASFLFTLFDTHGLSPPNCEGLQDLSRLSA